MEDEASRIKSDKRELEIDMHRSDLINTLNLDSNAAYKLSLLMRVSLYRNYVNLFSLVLIKFISM